MNRNIVLLAMAAIIAVLAIWLFVAPPGSGEADPGQPAPHAIDQSDS